MKRDAYGRLDVNSFPIEKSLSALTPSTPWALYLADHAGLFHFVAFDFDGKTADGINPDLMEQATDQCDDLARNLTALSIPHLVCESSGTGGRHLWIAFRDGISRDIIRELSSAAKANYSTLDFGMLHNPATGAVRPPLSPHRDGSTSRIIHGTPQTLLIPTVTVDAVRALTTALSASRPPLRPADTRPSGPIDADHRPLRALSNWGVGHMSTLAGGSNPSWTGFMCLLAATTAGWSFTDILAAADTAPGMEHYRTKNAGNGTRHPRRPNEMTARLERQWRKAQEFSALHRHLPPVAITPDLRELDTALHCIENALHRLRSSPGRWGGTEKGATARTILTALAYLTLHTGKPVIAASIRDLALLTGIGRTAARTALLTLEQSGFIRRITASTGSNAAEWQLTPHLSTPSPPLRPHPFNNPRPPSTIFNQRRHLLTTLEDQLATQRHDLFTRAGLGHLAGKVHALLHTAPALTVDRCATLLGVGLSFITRAISRLRHYRLIVPHGTGWAPSTRDRRHTVAAQLGLTGLLKDRAQRYQWERQVWTWWQAEVDTMTTTPRHRPARPHVTARTLFGASHAGERIWPRYPRTPLGRGDHRAARTLVFDGALDPTSRWQYLGDAA